MLGQVSRKNKKTGNKILSNKNFVFQIKNLDIYALIRF